MKKMIMFLALCVSLSVQAVELDHFINPLFYKDIIKSSYKMEEVARTLSPKGITLSLNQFQYARPEGDCQLIDQSQTRLLYRCFSTNPKRYNYPEELKYYKLYVLTGADTERKRCYVTLYERDFQDLELEYNPAEGNTLISYYYIKADDCGVTERTNPSE